MLQECPSIEQLSQLMDGRLPELLAAELEDHILRCNDCPDRIAKQFENAPGRDITRIMRIGPAAAPPPDDVHLRSIIDAAHRLGPDPQIRSKNGDVSARSSLDPNLTSMPLDPQLRRIGDYEILGEIARGGMGVVYKARHIRLRSLAAIKLIRAGEYANEGQIRRLQLEAQAAAQLTHPGIVSVHQVGEHEGQHFLAMAYVEGESLWQSLKDSPLDPKMAARLVQQVAEAVQYAHEMGIVHRDLKPQNILLTKDGHPRVVDFGLAKDQSGDSSLTMTGDILGTPSYMSPEQALGRTSQAGPPADVYSLGATLYCLLTGRPPFSAATKLETLRQVIEQDAVAPRQLNRSVPIDLETICLKCLEKHPDRRYSSAAALADELGRFLRGESILARPVSRWESAWRWCHRNPIAAALVVSVIVLIGLTGTTGWIMRSAALSRQASQLVEAFELQLDRPSLDPAFINQGESLLAAMTLLSPERVPQDRMRLWKTYLNTIEAGVLQLKLTNEDEKRLQIAIDLCTGVDQGDVVKLRHLLVARRRDWQPHMELTPPFSNHATMFSPGVVELRDNQLHLKTSATQADPLETSHQVELQGSLQGQLRAELEFDSQWETGNAIGVEIRYDDRNRYVFLMDTEPSSAVEGNQRSTTRTTFRKARAQGGEIRIRLLRNDALLRAQSIHVRELPTGRLRIDARRQGDHLAFRVGPLLEVEFDDPFSINSDQPAGLALIWPNEASLRSLRASRMPQDETISPLDTGDAFYDKGKLTDALDKYRNAATVAGEAEIRQEAQYKIGLCLLKLSRAAEAAEYFQSLGNDLGQRWPVLATVQLWATQIRMKERVAAEETFSRIASLYTMEQLAPLIPDDLRSDLLKLYEDDGRMRLIKMMTYEPDRVARLERRLKFQKLFSNRTALLVDARCQLIDGLWSSGKPDLADQHIESLVRDHPDDENAFNIYLKSLLRKRQAADALQIVDKAININKESYKTNPRYWSLLLRRAECQAQLGLWKEALADLVKMEEVTPEGSMQELSLRLEAAPLKGLLREALGDPEGAIESWRNGIPHDSPLRSGYLTNMHYLLLRSLSGDMNLQDVEIFLSRLQTSESGVVATIAQGVMTPAATLPILREMFRTEYGRDVVRKIAAGELFPSEQAREFVILFGYEMIRQGAFEGMPSNDQDELCKASTYNIYRAYAVDGTLNSIQLGQAALAWKGSMNVFGWAGIAPTLTTELRGPIAYILAHRLLTKSQVADATTVLRQAQAIAAPDSRLQSLVQRDLSLLAADQGVLLIRCSTLTTGRIEVLVDGQVVRTVPVKHDSELELPAGKCELRLDPATSGKLSATIFTVFPCRRFVVDVK